MRILVTGSEGFIGKNLCLALEQNNYEVVKFDRETKQELNQLISEVDFVMHLAGINRPLSNEEFYDGNTNLTYKIIEIMKNSNRCLPILYTSSVQAENDSDYGKSKKMAEDILFNYSKETNARVFVYRLSNAFGKWCKPNYNSVIATFCYKIIHDEEITIHNPEDIRDFIYIDDIVKSFITCVDKEGSKNPLYIEPSYRVSIGDLANYIVDFKKSRESFYVPNVGDPFIKKLYSTYLSYQNEDEFSYPLITHQDVRGSFTEILKFTDGSQVSVNVAKNGITKGNHWHHTKVEKFLVVSGKGIIRFRKIDESKIIEYFVSSDKFEVVDIPPGYTHNIENIGNEDLVTLMWCNEKLNQDNPDTYYNEV